LKSCDGTNTSTSSYIHFSKINKQTNKQTKDAQKKYIIVNCESSDREEERERESRYETEPELQKQNERNQIESSEEDETCDLKKKKQNKTKPNPTPLKKSKERNRTVRTSGEAAITVIVAPWWWRLHTRRSSRI